MRSVDDILYRKRYFLLKDEKSMNTIAKKKQHRATYQALITNRASHIFQSGRFDDMLEGRFLSEMYHYFAQDGGVGFFLACEDF